MRWPSASLSSLDGWVLIVYSLRNSWVWFGVGRIRILRWIPAELISLSKTCLLSESSAGNVWKSTEPSGVERREGISCGTKSSSSTLGMVCGGGVLYGGFEPRVFFLVADRLFANQALTALGSLKGTGEIKASVRFCSLCARTA